MLDKYWLGNNRKDIYVKQTQKGKEIYAKYVNYVLDACFNEIFRIADDISDEDNERFAKILDIFAEAFLRYFSEKPNGNEEIDILIKVE